GFANLSTNLFNTVTTGEAPQLSPTYGEYDDGASVFNNYWNFAGTSLPSGLVAGETGGTYSVNNGLKVTGGSSGYEGIFSNSAINPQTTISDFYGYLIGAAQEWSQFGLYGSTSAGGPQYFIYTPSANTYALGTFNGGAVSGTTITTSGSQTSSSIWSMWASTTHAYASYNYGSAVNNNASFASSTAQYVGTQAYSTSDGAFVQWLRTRAYPPSGVMPSVSFSTPVSARRPNLAVSPNPIIYGSTSTVTASGNPNTDTIELFMNGNLVGGPATGTITYTFNSLLPGNGAGSYTFNAFDENS
ncbi:MAG: hypothetical protein ACP5MB_11500, partial [bacterium]